MLWCVARMFEGCLIFLPAGVVIVNADVEKLIQNQASFERRVAEMDQVYAMLMAE